MTTTPQGEAKFHAARRMFAIIDCQPILAEKNTTEGHAEWFIRKGWITSREDPAFEAIVRGYSDGKDLYAYRGRNFLDDEPVESTMNRHAKKLKNMLNLPHDATLFLGSIPQTVGAQWPPRRSLGRIDPSRSL